jgi:hypothetical protein
MREIGLHDLLDLLDDGLATLERELRAVVNGVGPGSGDLELVVGGGAGVDGLVVGMSTMSWPLLAGRTSWRRPSCT